MKENYFAKIPPQKIAPPLEKLPPQEVTSLPEPGADLSQAEKISALPEKGAVDLMAVAESGGSGNEQEKSREKKEVMENARAERLAILGGMFARVKRSVETAIAPVKEKIDEKVPRARPRAHLPTDGCLFAKNVCRSGPREKPDRKRIERQRARAFGSDCRNQ